MRYFVTDTDYDMDAADTVVVTTRYEIERELVKKHVSVYCVNEMLAFRGYEKIDKQIDELMNHYIEQIIASKEQRILWDVIPDATDGIFGVSYEKAMMAVDNWVELLQQEPEEIIFKISPSNRIFCLIGKLAAEKQGIPISIVYTSWTEKIRGIKPQYSYLQKAYQNLVRYRNILKLVCQSKRKQLKKRGGQYQFGFVIASDALRILHWSIPPLTLARKTFGDDSVRVLCIDCDETYHKLEKESFPCDKLTDWFDRKIIRKEEREYKTYRKKLYRHMHKNLKFSYQGIDMTQIILSFFDQYLWCEKAYHYRLKMIYESYFSCNRFWCIEPWCTTRYYQTNICCLVSNGAKHCRVNGMPAFNRHDSFREVYPELFDYIFFPTMGLDLRKEYYEPNQWGKERFYASIRYSSIMQTWNQNKTKNQNTKINRIALLPGGIYVGKNILETEKILDCLEDFQIICKFHPQLAEHPSVLEYMNKKKDNVTFVDPRGDVADVIEKADIVITMFSTSMLDTMAAHKVCIVIPNEEEKDLLSYMDAYVNIWSVSQLKEKLLQITADTESSKVWYQEQLRKQDAFFVEDETLDEPYVQLKRIYEEQKKKI